MSEPSIEELQARMRPGALSQDGFLGPNESLEEALAEDERTLRALALEASDLAAALERLIETGQRSPERTGRIHPFEIRVEVFTGFQICPWTPDLHHGQCTAGGGVRFANLDWRIRNTRSGQEMTGPGLIVHLIRDHSFFEGKQSPQRVDPRDLARLLELTGRTDDADRVASISG